jgi:hypothetical protein
MRPSVIAKIDSFCQWEQKRQPQNPPRNYPPGQLRFRLTHEAIQEVRRIVQDLRPSILDELGIPATAAWFCRYFQNVYGGHSDQSFMGYRKIMKLSQLPWHFVMRPRNQRVRIRPSSLIVKKSEIQIPKSPAHQPFLHGINGWCGRIVKVHFFHEVSTMFFNRFETDTKISGNLLVLITLGNVRFGSKSANRF